MLYWIHLRIWRSSDGIAGFLGSTRPSPPRFVDMVAILKEWLGMEEWLVRADSMLVVILLKSVVMSLSFRGLYNC